ncbi:hypothetical protein [Chengkuizengella marina]|uniref:Bacteriophage holin of superfamily 6 (Holin_LLH) n=1 Tax=Chengkuizengella marina TaxID=2507566 RepID=A0A6N9Q198_9BACL|nr:hypothetical protein [Chengkuizengella marina]NBI28573.1 hypothetical protein [Chengkuizengella marina]
METVWIILISVVIIVIGLFLYPYLKSKGYVTHDSIKLTDQLLLFVKIIVSKNVDVDNKEKFESVFDAIRDIILYAQDVDESEDLEYIKQETITAIISRLKSLEVEIDYENELLIEIIVENALGFEARA